MSISVERELALPDAVERPSGAAGHVADAAPARPLYLEGSGTPFFAVLHRPAGVLTGTAVLLCPPFGWQDMSTYRIRREWAEHLARAGHTTLRIDLPGSGDSAGGPNDPARLRAWTQAVDDAARWLRGTEGAAQIAAIGIGLGGMVSCTAALRGTPIDELVLWSVPSRGRTLLRELRVFSAMESANVIDDGGPAPGSEDDGTLVANGYLLSAETVQDLEGLDLADVEPASPSLRHALLLGRDGLKVDEALPGVLERAGAEVTVADGPGYGAMMAELPEASPPTEVFELVDSWLAQRSPRLGASTPPPRLRGAREGTAAVGEPIEHDDLLLHHCGVGVRETPIFFDGPGGRLFGVLTEPLGARRELTALLLNAGLQPRTGPNRMWVEIARRWAANGVPSLRLDAAGVGDFDGEAIALGHAKDFYKPVYVEQACAALDTLAGLGLPPRFMTIGFCSGGHCSVQTALADERVAAALMINPVTLVFDDADWQWRYTLRQMRHLRERVLLASTWRKLLRGEIRLEKHLETGRTFVERAVTAPMSARERIIARRSENGSDRRRAGHEPIEGLLDALRDREQRALLLFTGKAPLHRQLDQNGVLDHLDRWPNLGLALLGSSVDTNTLNPLWLQREVHALLDRVLDDELARLAT